MPKRTPGPWKAQKSQIGSAWVIYGPDEFPIASTPSNSTPKGFSKAVSGNLQANAEFIATACNSHDELVQLLRAADNKLQGMLVYHSGERAMAIEAFRAKVAAALAKVGP